MKGRDRCIENTNTHAHIFEVMGLFKFSKKRFEEFSPFFQSVNRSTASLGLPGVFTPVLFTVADSGSQAP